MMGAVPPDGYLGGDREIGKVLVQQLGIHLDQLGDYIIIAQVDLPCVDWDIIVSPDAPIDLIPDLLRCIADRMSDRARRLAS